MVAVLLEVDLYQEAFLLVADHACLDSFPAEDLNREAFVLMADHLKDYVLATQFSEGRFEPLVA